MAFRTDHFKFYSVGTEATPPDMPIALRGQFDNPKLRPPNHRLRLLNFFGNPVDKSQEGIRDPKAHLSWYSITGLDLQTRPIRALVTNQFGKVRLEIGGARFLLAPALKEEAPEPLRGDPPTNLSHFKGYEVLRVEGFEERNVTLQDQFDRRPVSYRVLAPVYLGVPVTKTVRKRTSRVVNSDDHLVIYPIVPIRQRRYEERRRVLDQFGVSELRAFIPSYLGVPSTKKVLKRPTLVLKPKPRGR